MRFSAASFRWRTATGPPSADTERKGYDADGFDYGDEGNRYKGLLESSRRFGDDQMVHRLTGTLDFKREEFQNTTPSDFVFRGRRSTRNIGLVGQYELIINDAFFAGGSIRHDDDNRFADATTWRAWARYRPPFGLRLRGACGTGDKNRGYYELYGYSYGAISAIRTSSRERSEGCEAGIDRVLVDGQVTFRATYFHSRLKDEIYTTYPAPDYVATPANRDRIDAADHPEHQSYVPGRAEQSEILAGGGWETRWTSSPPNAAPSASTTRSVAVSSLRVIGNCQRIEYPALSLRRTLPPRSR